MSFMTRADSQPWQVRCPEVKYSSRVTFLTPLKGWRIWVVLVKVSAIFTLLIRSPRTAGPQPRDVLRLAKPSFARLRRPGATGSLASRAGGPAPGRAAARPAPPTPPRPPSPFSPAPPPRGVGACVPRGGRAAHQGRAPVAPP